MRERVILGLGANVGRPLEQLAAAVEALRRVVDEARVSSVYRTEPVGYAEQPDFFNVVMTGTTGVEPEALLDAMQAVEREMGRVRSFANAPRPIDVDLLAYGSRVLGTPRLVVPHPGIAVRGFVLHPLHEVAPDWRHPVLLKTARELLLSAAPLERVERLGALPPFG